MKTSEKAEAPFITIGTNTETVREARGAINDILKSKVDTAVKLQALQSLTSLTQVHNATITGCSFQKGS
jgi:hypothetical protein